MKLLFDQNLSYKLVSLLRADFPASQHVFSAGKSTATDEEIWQYAKKEGYMIVTQDSDFFERAVLFGFPPKVIWIRTGNARTKKIAQLLRGHKGQIFSFYKDVASGCLVLQ